MTLNSLFFSLRALRVFIFAFFAWNYLFHAKNAKVSHAKYAKMSLATKHSEVKDLFGLRDSSLSLRMTEGYEPVTSN